MAQQTAIKWLEGVLKEYKYLSKDADHYFQAAKQMEKEQMFEFTKKHHIIGEHSRKFYTEEFEQYYNETYGGQESSDTTTSPTK